MGEKLLIVQVAALGWGLVEGRQEWAEMKFAGVEGFFPAVTCTAQAGMRTAALPREHGMVGNGVYWRELGKVMFWEQSAGLVAGERIWRQYRSGGGARRRVGMMFWQQSLGDRELDLVYSPAPIHKHEGGMIQACYEQPEGLGEVLRKGAGGRAFNLMHYWGPLAGGKSSEWIVDATCGLMRHAGMAPELLFSYVPHLDYDLQRHGPGSGAATRALRTTLKLLRKLKAAAEECGYETLFYGDYGIEAVDGGAAHPNRRLREAGLLRTREIRRMQYADLAGSAAFAVADHQVAHVYCADARAEAAAREALGDLDGVEAVLDREGQAELGVDHARSGELLLVAGKGRWFAYPWWEARREVPDYATHVDIHNKPGYDPCELFFGWPPGVSLDTRRVRGTHGRPGGKVAVSTTLEFAGQPATMLDVARLTKVWLDAKL